MYQLQDLLEKMGAPEVEEKRRIAWHYFGKAADTGKTGEQTLAGAAEIRLEAEGERLIAEMKHIQKDFTDEDGAFHENHTDVFYFSAERTARPGYYRVTQIAFDGVTYDRPSRAITELGLGIFHAKALSINILMVEQMFNKQDILEPVTENTPSFRHFLSGQAKSRADIRPENFGTVIAFRPRKSIRASA